MTDAFLVYSRDHEDADIIGFSCVVPIPKEYTKTFAKAVEFLLPVLSSKEFVDKMIEKDCLKDDFFKGAPYKFVSCAYRNYMLEYDFEYAGGDAEEFKGELCLVHQKSMKFVCLV